MCFCMCVYNRVLVYVPGVSAYTYEYVCFGMCVPEYCLCEHMCVSVCNCVCLCVSVYICMCVSIYVCARV